MKSILFVCIGNICRSPAAETVFKKMATDRGFSFRVESRGVGDWFLGHSADSRTRDVARARGYEIETRARLLVDQDLIEFDYILVADRKILATLKKRAEALSCPAKILLMTAFSTTFKDQEVPDPFYQADAAFEEVLDIVEESCHALLNHITQNETHSK